MRFQENLKRYRLSVGYKSARQFAESIGIPYATYATYENMKSRSEPRYETLCRIATALHVTTDELLGYDPYEYERYANIAIKAGFTLLEGDAITVLDQSGEKTIKKAFYQTKEEFAKDIAAAYEKYSHATESILKAELNNTFTDRLFIMAKDGIKSSELSDKPETDTAPTSLIDALAIIAKSASPPAAGTKNTSRKKRTTKKGTPSADK